MSDVTQILNAIDRGDRHASEELLPLVYDELRRLAAQRLSRESPGQTLQATALVHDAFVRLVDAEHRQQWNSRGHFFGAAAEAMRRILIEQARRKRRIRHGGQMVRQELDEADISAPESMASELKHDLLAIDEALQRFANEEPLKARLVELRFFAGLTVEDAAQVLGMSTATAKRHWRFARAWLHQAITAGEPSAPVDSVTGDD